MQVFNVKDFGATGDGLTDDAAAIQAAVTACHNDGGGIVRFPVGDYLVETTIATKDTVMLVGEESPISGPVDTSGE